MQQLLFILLLAFLDRVIADGVWVNHQLILGVELYNQTDLTCDLLNIYTDKNSLSFEVRSALSQCGFELHPFDGAGEPPSYDMEQQLYALVDSYTNCTLGVSLDLSYLIMLRENLTHESNSQARIRAGLSGDLDIKPLNVSNARYHPQDRITDAKYHKNNLVKDWTTGANFVFYYAAGGAVLMIFERHNQYQWYRRVLNAYFSLAWSLGAAMGRIAYLLHQGFIYGSNGYGEAGWGGSSATQNPGTTSM